MFGTLNSIPPSIHWRHEKIFVGHVFWPMFLISAPVTYSILDKAFAVYGDIPAVTHPIAFMVSLLVLLVLPSFMVTGYYLLWRSWKGNKTAHSQPEDGEDVAIPHSGKFAMLALISGMGFVPLLLFVAMLAGLEAIGVDVQDDNTRHMLVGGLVAAALIAERWSKIGVNFMLGGLLLWGGIYVHWHLADDTLSRWLLFDSGIL